MPVKRPAKTSGKSGLAVRVVLADSNPLFLDALARAVRQDPMLEVLETVESSDALRQALGRHSPDVVVADRDVLQGEGPLRPPASGGPKLLLLANEIEDGDVYRAIAGGAAGYLSKDAEATTLRRAIHSVARGETPLDRPAQTVVAREIRLRGRDDRPLLSPREREILVMIADGRTAPEIARRLHLSTATVKTHILHLYDKLDVTERAAAVAEAMRRGILE